MSGAGMAEKASGEGKGAATQLANANDEVRGVRE